MTKTSTERIAAIAQRLDPLSKRHVELQQQVMDVIADMQKEGIFDPRWLAIVKTDLEKAFIVLGQVSLQPLVELAVEGMQGALVTELLMRKAAEKGEPQDRVLEKLDTVYQWINALPIPTAGATTMGKHLYDIRKLLSAEHDGSVERCAKKAGRDPRRCDRDYCSCGAEGSPSAAK